MRIDPNKRRWKNAFTMKYSECCDVMIGNDVDTVDESYLRTHLGVALAQKCNRPASKDRITIRNMLITLIITGFEV